MQNIAVDGYGLIKERSYRTCAYRVIELHKCVFDEETQTWCGYSGQAWYVIDKYNFFIDFEEAVDQARWRIKEE